MAAERIVRVVPQSRREPTVGEVFDNHKFELLRAEARRVLQDVLPQRKLDREPLTEREGQVLREAQAAGALPLNLPVTAADVTYGARVRTETFAGRYCEGDVWQGFAGKNLVLGKFNRPDAATIAAAQERAKGWWQP